MGTRKIAIINQRYGMEVNGGSEQYTRMIAEHLQRYYEVEVLTTCALDYDTWKNSYPEGIEIINGVRVRRFKVAKERKRNYFRVVNKIISNIRFQREKLENYWIKEQGPYSPEAVAFIENNQEKYDVFIFVTYLYYLTAVGLPKVAEKSILIPTAHDEPCIYFDIYKNIFTMPKGIVYLTEAEKRFVESQFPVKEKRNDVVAVGMEIPQATDGKSFCEKYRISEPYVIYVGRIDAGKNCGELFKQFLAYKRKHKSNLKLVLLGKSFMEIPKNEDIISLGFVSEENKYNGIAGAKGLIMPSEYESLSLVVLEAMALGVPVLVNGACSVLKDHCLRSRAGVTYSDESEFEKCIRMFEKEENGYAELKKNGPEYVQENYEWKSVEQKLVRFIESVIEG